MSDRHDFFTTVLPDTGLYCILGLKGEIRKQALLQSLDEVDSRVEFLLKNEFNVYFGCATFGTRTGGRKADNAEWFKSFRVDLDCGEGKQYASQHDAVIALKAFNKQLQLPKPLLVNSGNGVHAYWLLNDGVAKRDWVPVANALANACKQLGLFVDPSCTEDVARVLRVPGTKNFKTAPARDVFMMQQGIACGFESFRELLKAYIRVTPENELGFDVPKHIQMDAVTKALLNNKVSNFGTIMKKSLQGSGCNQLAKVYREQTDIDYNLWRGGLSIAINCEDGAKAIHKLSSKHPEYSPEATERKAQDSVDKPYRCETFAGFFSDGCKNCPHSGKISSPIQLGVHIEEATAEDNKVEVPDKETGKSVIVDIPKYPFPYFRGKNGGVYRKGIPDPGAEEATEDELIYKNDLYVTNRLIDPDSGESVRIVLHTANDGIREFICPLTNLVAKEKMSAILAKNGIVLMYKKLDNVINYIARWVEELQHMDKAETAYNQFGWHDNDKKFIVGNREITSEGIRRSPSSTATSEIATFYGRKGNIHDWSVAANVYAAPGNEPRAFAFFMGFGSVFLKFLNLDGGILHLTNNSSGVGKSTIQLLINSIWGHPKLALSTEADKPLARIQRAVTLGNICMTIDEMTNASNEAISDLAYVISHGRGRNRLQGSNNAERSNALRWALIAVTSGNKSLHDQLFSLKEFPEGELMRILELTIEKTDLLTKEETDALFSPIYDNYGVAGDIFMSYVVPNLDECLKILSEVQRRIDKAAGLTQRERYWSGMAACAITGGMISNKLGLHSIPHDAVYRWAINMLIDSRGEVKPNLDGGMSKVGQFLNEHMNNMLVVNSNIDKRKGMMEAPIREPRGELSIRYEPDTKMLYIVVKAMREWCSDNQISFKAIKHDLAMSGVLTGEVKRCMSKGSDINSPAVWALAINCKNIPDFNTEELINGV